MEEEHPTVEQVRFSQEKFIEGSSLHESKKYKEAIEAFKESSSAITGSGNQWEILEQKLVKGSYKLLQKSIAYMGGAANNLFELMNQLSEEEREQVPINEPLYKAIQPDG